MVHHQFGRTDEVQHSHQMYADFALRTTNVVESVEEESEDGEIDASPHNVHSL